MKRALVFVTTLWAGAALACADFSGKWTGSCVESGQTQQAATEIAQVGCQAITIDGTQLTIGQTATSTRTEQGVTETLKRTPAWDSAQAVLTETTNLVAVQNGRTVFELDGTTTYALRNGQLVSTLNETGRESNASPTTRQATCTFTKQ